MGNSAVQFNLLFPKTLVLHIPLVGLDLPTWGDWYFELSDNRESMKFSIMKEVETKQEENEMKCQIMEHTS